MSIRSWWKIFLGDQKRHRMGGIRENDGFTLVELIVVLAIIALIATIATPQVMKYLGSAKIDTARVQIRNLETALDLYYIDVGHYPLETQGLVALTERPASETSWSGPYIKGRAALTDPWGKPYGYKSPSGQKPFEIFSLGRDGREGGDGQDGDLRNE